MGPVPEWARDVPRGGRDVLASRVGWLFPEGRIRGLSVRDLACSHQLGIATEGAEETDIVVAASFGYAYLGVAVDSAALDALKAAPGTVQEKR